MCHLQKKEELSDWVSSSYVAFNLYFCLLELYHELFKSKRPRLTKNNLIKLIKILDHHYLNYNFENLYSLL